MLSPAFGSWFAVHVAPQHERKVMSLLDYKGYQLFLPTYKSRRSWSDRTKILELPLFPGYLFCRFEAPASGPVLTTPGVLRIVSFGGRPSPILDDEIEALAKVSQFGHDVQPEPYSRPGEKVRIVKGPLSGVIGTVAEVRNHRRLIVSVDIILRSISVAIHAADVVAERPLLPLAI